MPVASSSAELIQDLQHRLDKHSTTKQKAWWEAYLRGAIHFRGVGIPTIRIIVADWRRSSGVDRWTAAKQFAIALELFEQPLAEDKLAGILFIQQHLLCDVPWRVALDKYAALYRRKLIFDWSTCDWFCVRVLGPMIKLNGAACANAIAAWNRSANVWQARSSVVPFVTVAADTQYHPLLLRSCAVLIQRDERFAKTAVGWVLRELSKHDAAAVNRFVQQYRPHFSTEALKNALKYAGRP